MSNWGLGSMGEGFSKLSTLAESAALKAAAVTAEAEAKLVASLNADGETAAARAGERPGGPARQEGEGLDFTAMPRRELEELCAKRSDKLKQAVQKIRAQQQEHARVQRDYEQLQEIVRADNLSRGGDDRQAAQAMLDLKDARDHCAILRQQLDERDGTIAQLRAQLQTAGSAAVLDGASASRAGASACCEELRAEIEAMQAKLQQAQQAASSADAGGEALRRARAEHAAALEDAEKRAAERLARAEGERQMVQQQLEEAMRLGHDGDARQASVGDAQSESEQLRAEVSQLKQENTELRTDLAKEKEKIGKLKVKSQEIVGKFKTQAAEKKELEDRMQELLAAQAAAAGAPAEVPDGYGGACDACKEMATELSNLEAAKIAAEREKQKLEVQCQELEERARKLDNERMRADEAAERLEEALAGYQDQVAELQTRAHKLENELETSQASHATTAAAEANEKQGLTAKVVELQRALDMCQDELRESRNERETTVAQLESDIERVREESRENEAKSKEKAKSIIEAAKAKTKSMDDARKAALREVDLLTQQLQEASAAAPGPSNAEEGDGASAMERPSNESQVQALEGELAELRRRLVAAEEARKEAEDGKQSVEEEMQWRREEDKEEMQALAAKLEQAQESERKFKEKAKLVVEQAKNKSKQTEEEKKEIAEERDKVIRELSDLRQQHDALQQQHTAAVNQVQETAAKATDLQEAMQGKSRVEAELAAERERAQHVQHALQDLQQQLEQAQSGMLEAQQQREQLQAELAQAKKELDCAQQTLQEHAARMAIGSEAEGQLQEAQQRLRETLDQLQQARDGHAAAQQQLASTQNREQELLVQLKAADKRADDNAGAASAAESEFTSKIAEVNEKCARFYQDREDARDMLADSQAAATSYKRALLAVKYALKTPVMLGREASLAPEETQKLKTAFGSDASGGKVLKDADGTLVSILVEEVEQGMIEALEFAVSRSSAWQDARRALEGDVNKSEKRARQAQEKLDAKQKEVVNLLEALKTAESKSSSGAGKGDGKARVPMLSARDGARMPQVLHRVWAGGTGWALLSGMGEESEPDWFYESAVRSAFAEAEDAAGGQDALERAGAPVVLEELPMRERKIAEVTAALEKKQQELVAVQEEYRAYKIKAHTVLRQKKEVAPERDEDAEAARRRKEVQDAVDRERAKMAAKVKGAEESAEAARQNGERQVQEAKEEARVLENRAQVLEEKIAVLEEQLSSALQRERERDLELAKERQERELERQKDKDELARARKMEQERGHDDAGERRCDNDGSDPVNTGSRREHGEDREAVLVLKRQLASMEHELVKAREEQHSASRALESSKEKAQAMLLEKDAVITSLRTRLKAGATGGSEASASVSAADGYGENSDVYKGGGPLLAPGSDSISHVGGEEANGESFGDDLLGQQLYFAQFERPSIERRPSTETQEDQILHVAQMQAQQTEYVASLLEKISLLKDNVSEGKRLQDLLCRERDQLREALEVMKREADSTKRVERYNSKFREGTNIEYLKNVLLKYIETQDEGLIPVFSSVLEFDADEQRRLHAAQSRLSSPWSKLGTKLGGGLF